VDPFQREVIDRLARIETKTETLQGIAERVTSLERAEGRRNAIVALLVGLPAAVAAAWQIITRSPT
jgi:hypothetical protein